MKSTHSFRDLLVWQKGIELSLEVYKVCSELPESEKFGLASQVKRASVSVPSNIAEGYKRNGRKEYIQFCSIACGSAAEVETQLIIITRLFPYISTAKAGKLSTELQKMLTVFIGKLRA